MGRNSKKKKRGGGGGGGGSGRRIKGRTPSKDHYVSQADDDNELLSEEITALCAIFQEDCKIVSGSPPQIIIKIRPHSKDMGYEDLDVSALLVVRCLPGYPYKCPKLQITPEIGLTESDADNLLSLLHEQAISNSREGRVMIFNLVEAAQEFLSEIVPAGQLHESVSSMKNSNGQLFQDTEVSSNKSFCPKGPFVCGFIDLFCGSGDSWHWSLGVDNNRGTTSSVQSHRLDSSNLGYKVQEKLDKNAKQPAMEGTNQGLLHSPTAKLDTVEEESEDDDTGTSTVDSSGTLVEELEGKEDTFLEQCRTEDDDDDDESEPSESLSSASFGHEKTPQAIEKDLVMVHLLRLACSSKGPLSDVLPPIATELHNLGIFSERVRDLASKPSSLFNRTFDHVFQQQMVSSMISQFWKPASDFGGPSTSLPSSRYLNDFEEIQSLGHGGFGHVVLCKNKLDGRQYAVKKIRLKDKILPVNDRILREVATLSRLQHQHVVRYYQAWFETGVAGSFGDTPLGSVTAASSTFSYKGASSADDPGQENKLESTFLYIQMEFCPRTLRQLFESYNHFDKELAWHLFHQIVEGLAHIHGQGIIHRDLTPSNIFFDSRNDIKIGDFGLAKFLKLEQLDQDGGFPTDTTGVSVDGTGQVGTYFYTAPEIEQGWPKIDEKADMYSVGVVFFELWHPFGTAMERHVVLSDLKLKGELPAAWVAEFPEQASLLRRLMSPSPSDRPSATELLQYAFPPRMEYELLDNILRTMQSSEDTSVYDKVVNAIFDEEMLGKNHHQPVGRLRMAAHDTLSIQYTDLGTELRDYVVEVTREVYRLHCAKHLEIIPMRLLDDCSQFNRNTVKLLTHGGDMIELCHELRLPFVSWLIANQKSSFKRYEISYVYRKAIGHSPPNRYLQGDFDIVGGASALTEAEVIKVTMDVVNCFFHSDSCDVHLNHGGLLDAIWSWAGIKAEHVHKVAERLSLMGSLRPQSSERKLKWVVIRRQLLQELNLAEAVVNRLQTVGLRFCGAADQALPRLRGALPADRATRKALDELSDLFSYLRVWKIEKHVYIDSLMAPTESYHRDLFFQIYLTKENQPGSLFEGALLAVGGRYDYLLHQMWNQEYKTNSPGAVGSSLALETLIQHSLGDYKPIRNEGNTNILVCSRGGGGLLVERMELVAELWEENIKAEFVPIPDPSLTEQYEYANEHDIKCLVIITDTGVSQTGSVKVRHLELKKEKEVERENIVRFLLEAMATQFRNPLVWI
ncbi:Pkinase domain-containing protein/RWD domain-containing protein/HGTP_anticodon2 domain-containing protein/tRNA-synt_His domain-containing protein [Cephalotus follicularis]|uniref:non-specific serine/threonine protein kinase n=1 Tax=Cephalotus follicularis TaxID=3775 RepID=A0A1Q3BP84_CEPFO|nr:Pkinase domain-containing protein/RWD domain-containing protein/HGTP_anticodon2 domain-containing protein/tRNA-synt_His domain-containing protein [Cephalotus follicularis]